MIPFNTSSKVLSISFPYIIHITNNSHFNLQNGTSIFVVPHDQGWLAAIIIIAGFTGFEAYYTLKYSLYFKVK